MDLQAQVGEVFAPDGLLVRVLEAFTPRPGQAEMALAVARTLEQGGALVVEAGTGIGKTFAYLVPALLGGQRVLLSTATKTLQDQLFGRDLPLLIKALGLPIRSALLKGRASYLCLHRLGLARQSQTVTEPVALRSLAKIEQWAQTTRSGDLAELPGLDERSPVIPLVSSTRENCLGTQCPQLRFCHVNQARREALASDVVVINHHLFFADLSVRESGMAELLPSVQTVIFDEAHQLNETGVQFLGRQLGTGQVLDFARDVLSTGLQQARGLRDWQRLGSATERATRALRLLAGPAASGARLRWLDGAPEQVDVLAWQASLLALRNACDETTRALRDVCDISPDLVRLSERGAALLEQLEFFATPCARDAVRWLELGAQVKLVESALDIAHTVQARLLHATQQEGARRSWIFTSATLGNEARLRWFTEPCGLAEAEILRVDSPFDYGAQAALYVPPDLARPGDAAHSAQVAEFVARAASVLGGRTLVLTTTLRALQAISALLQGQFQDPGGLQILVQGQQTKRELLERFRHGGDSGSAGSILVASASFWEGVDLPGEALQMVVIDKLPFPPPNDPLVQARAKRLEASGGRVFNDYFIPEAAMALKQGAGRLIRSESDRGLLVVCDPRLLTMAYGRRLLGALPPMRRIRSEEELSEVLLALTRPSTRDPG